MLVSKTLTPPASGLAALRVDARDLRAPRVSYAVPAWLVLAGQAVAKGHLTSIILTNLQENK